jgi:hypothetical protein
MSDDPLEESWEAWTTRIAGELDALADDEWLTVTVHVGSRASSTYAAGPGRRSWRRGGSRAAPPARVPDVFVQARRVEGVLALECIGDTEFEGVTELTREEQAALVALGWGREGTEPELSRTFERASDAARLLRASLSDVLGAGSPSDVDLRRAPPR